MPLLWDCQSWLLIRPQVASTPTQPPFFFLGSSRNWAWVHNLAFQDCWEAANMGLSALLFSCWEAPKSGWVKQCLCYPVSQPQNLQKNREACLFFVQGEQWSSCSGAPDLAYGSQRHLGPKRKAPGLLTPWNPTQFNQEQHCLVPFLLLKLLLKNSITWKRKGWPLLLEIMCLSLINLYFLRSQSLTTVVWLLLRRRTDLY